MRPNSALVVRPVLIESFGNATLVGTAHVSLRSVAEVAETIRRVRPDQVHIELDAKRHEALADPERWKQTDILQVLRERKQHLFLLQLVLANMQARIGSETGAAPGSEMIKAIEVADELGAEVVLIDRDVSVTLKRGFATMGFVQRLKLFWNIWMDAFTPKSSQEPMSIDDLLETDAITAMTEEFARFAPSIKLALIDERDAYMASHVKESLDAGNRVVAVVGAGHVPGMLRHLNAGTEADRLALSEPPPPRLTVGKVVGYAVPLAILGVFVYLIVAGRFAELREVAFDWIVINGALSAIGAILALGHPLSVLVAFVAAPITSLNPALAAGWFAGLTEAKMRTPKVVDFERIKTADGWKDLYTNPVVRILLVTALANLGSVAGTYIAGLEIVRTLT